MGVLYSSASAVLPCAMADAILAADRMHACARARARVCVCAHDLATVLRIMCLNIHTSFLGATQMPATAHISLQSIVSFAALLAAHFSSTQHCCRHVDDSHNQNLCNDCSLQTQL